MSFTKAKAYLESVGFADHIIEPETSTHPRALATCSNSGMVSWTALWSLLAASTTVAVDASGSII